MSDVLDLGILLGFFMAYSIVISIFYILEVIGMWRIFSKAGEKGWKALIPVYNVYIMFKISYHPGAFAIFLISAVIGGVFSGISLSNPSAILLIISFIFYFVAAFTAISCEFFLSKSFGHGVGFGLGLVFLGPVFMLILGFSSDKYIGNIYEVSKLEKKEKVEE